MKTVYLIPPGTRIAESRDGSDFRLKVLLSQLQFEAEPELTDSDAVFTAGQRRIRVDRGAVVVSRYDGHGARNQFGI